MLLTPFIPTEESIKYRSTGDELGGLQATPTRQVGATFFASEKRNEQR